MKNLKPITTRFLAASALFAAATGCADPLPSTDAETQPRPTPDVSSECRRAADDGVVHYLINNGFTVPITGDKSGFTFEEIKGGEKFSECSVEDAYIGKSRKLDMLCTREGETILALRDADMVTFSTLTDASQILITTDTSDDSGKNKITRVLAPQGARCTARLAKMNTP